MDTLVKIFFWVVDAVCSQKQGRPPKPKRGHPFTHPTSLIVKLLFLSTLKGWSLGQIAQNLRKKEHSNLRKLIGVSARDVPTKSCLCKRAKHPQTEAFLRRVFWYLRKRLVLRPISDLKVLVMDLTDIPVEPRYDPYAKWGHVRQEEVFYGYKLHLLLNHKGVILQAFVTTANKTETFRSLSMLAGIAKMFNMAISQGCLGYVVADSGYDAEANYKMVQDCLLGLMVCKENPRNKKADKPPGGKCRSVALRFSSTKKGKSLYGKRCVVEQVIGQLKELFGFKHIPYWVKGLKAVRLWLMWRILVYTTAQYVNLLNHRPLRHVKSLVQ